ncbi:MAG TPA: iron ABC transporter permease [Chloroflexi bacterium]|nr:iron ABC transporter permease [Chloroflexota bacterium]
MPATLTIRPRAPRLRLILWGFYLIPIVFLLLFFVYPLLSIFQISLAPEGRLDVRGLQQLFSRPYYLGVLWFTTWQATASTALTLLFGLPAAYAFARFRFPGKDLLRALTTVPFVMPSVVVATAFLALLGPTGFVNLWLMNLLGLDHPPLNLYQTIWLVLLAHAFYNVTIIVRIVGGFWANLDPRLEEAAAVLGANRRRVFREVTLPLLMPAIGAAALLVFLFTFSSFGIILILGGPRLATIEVEVYRQTVNLFNLPLAATLSILQMVATFLIMTIYTELQERTTVPLTFRAQTTLQRVLHTWRERLYVLGAVGLVVGMVLAPLLALVARSLTVLSSGVSLRAYQALTENPTRSIFFVPPTTAIRNSVTFALLTLVLSLGIGTISAYFLTPPRGLGAGAPGLRRLLDPLFMLPLGTSAVTLGFGYIIALDEPPLNLRASPILIPLAHTLVAFPFVVRTLLPVLRGINPALREAAGVLGAAPARVLREVDLPIVGRALLVGAVFAFAVSMGEFGATSLIARPETPTMPIVIFRFLGQPGARNYAQALAMSSLLMLVTAVGFFLIERLRYEDVGEF